MGLVSDQLLTRNELVVSHFRVGIHNIRTERENTEHVSGQSVSRPRRELSTFLIAVLTCALVYFVLKVFMILSEVDTIR